MRQISRPRPAPSFVLASLLALAGLAAACGPATPDATTPAGTPTASASASAPPPSTGEASTPPPPSTGEPGPTPPPAAANQSQQVKASAFLADVQKLGIDLKNPPLLEKMDAQPKKRMMEIFRKALGYDSCKGCHVETDFKKETRNVKIARQMWNHFVKELRDKQGGPIFCDSCHGGKNKPLDHAAGLKDFMKSDYVGKLARADGKEQSCATCHGDGMEMHIVEKLWGIAPK